LEPPHEVTSNKAPATIRSREKICDGFGEVM
jgi:hypothetical protein